MKPKNKFQKQVFELSESLPSITRTQVKWAHQNCIEHIGRRTKKGVITCLECGYSWTDTTTESHCVCPDCRTRLQIDGTRRRVFRDYGYFCTVTACEGFQVLRFFYIQYDARVGEKARYFHSEVVQRWIASTGKHASIARLRPMTCFADTWNFCSPLEIRPEKPLYNVIPSCVYPRQKLIPELKRNGYSGEFHKLTPFDLFHALLTDSRAETLLKAGQTSLLRFFVANGFRHISRYWLSIKICMRSGYEIGDASLWCDYIDLLRFFGKDLHNVKYVCPADLTAEHDHYVKKKRAYQERERREEARKKALVDEALFKEMKSRFFGIRLWDCIIPVLSN